MTKEEVENLRYGDTVTVNRGCGDSMWKYMVKGYEDGILYTNLILKDGTLGKQYEISIADDETICALVKVKADPLPSDVVLLQLMDYLMDYQYAHIRDGLDSDEALQYVKQRHKERYDEE